MLYRYWMYREDSDRPHSNQMKSMVRRSLSSCSAKYQKQTVNPNVNNSTAHLLLKKIILMIPLGKRKIN